MNPNSFREYDIRGVADRDLSDDLATNIGRVFVSMLSQGRPADAAPLRICVARDCRVSGPRLLAALTKGFMLGGAHVIDVGEGPTPSLYFAVHHLGADGGIMVTGSHNPGDENGFKMMRGKASFFGADIQTMRARIQAGDLGASPGSGTHEVHPLHDAYLTAMTKGIALGPHAVPVVLDAGNGAGGPLGLAAHALLGIATEGLYCDMDGTFPNHHPDPTVPKNLVKLIERVKASGARVGLAYDGDADRLGAVDEEGTIIWGDKLMILFSRALLKQRPGSAIIGEVKCSQTMYDDITKHGGEAVMWKTGHSLIKTKMKEKGALLAGEMSGHLFFADRYFGFDDALYAGLRLIEILSQDSRSLSQMLADVPHTFSTPEIRLDCPDEKKFAVVQSVLAHYRGKQLDVIDIDGARISFGTATAPAWGLVRASNTGPILVMRFEAPTQAELLRIQAEVEAVVAAQLAH
jgi:phosphomannomutase / phosphoglucomutase